MPPSQLCRYKQVFIEHWTKTFCMVTCCRCGSRVGSGAVAGGLRRAKFPNSAVMAATVLWG